MRIREFHHARRPRVASGVAGAGACALAVLAVLVSTSARALDEAPKRFSVQLALPDGRETFHRGGLDPAAAVEGLVLTVTLTNTYGDLPVSLPVPQLTAHGGVAFARAKTVAEGGSSGLAFDVHLLGAPTGVPMTDDTPERTPVTRCPLPLPVSTVMAPPMVTLQAGESKEFQVNVGAWYAIRQAGRYEISAVYENERSNPVEFEVLPLKVVNARAKTLLSRETDFERRGADYPFMFYVVRGGGRFDEVVYRVRRGRGGDEHYEYHRLSETAPGKVPQLVTSPEKPGVVGVLVPDKRSDSLSRLFTVDLSVMPLRVSGKEIAHAPGQVPEISIDASGKVSAR